ncbi:hypothetical protein CLOM_g9020 [Closterium sp. NIES-68]|nr:hypothetical protein CLOM_g9020 [Closterium sp. NIES-68]
MGWARARDAGGRRVATERRFWRMRRTQRGYREGVIGVQIGGRRGDERLSRVGVCTTRDAEEPSSNPSFGGIEPAVDNELSNFADSASARMFCGTRGATIATSALGGCRRAVPGAPQVVLPHLYSRLAASGEYFTGEGWDRLDGGEECIEEEEGERGAVGGDEYWGERAEGVVAGCGGPGAAGAAAVAAAAAAAAAAAGAAVARVILGRCLKTHVTWGQGPGPALPPIAPAALLLLLSPPLPELLLLLPPPLPELLLKLRE